MQKSIEVTQEFTFAEVYRDLVWFGNEFQKCAAVKFEASGDPSIPADLSGRQFVFETRVGTNRATGKSLAGILIYEVKVDGQEGEYFASVSRDLDLTEDPEVIFADPENMLTVESVEMLLLVVQKSVIEFRGELDQPKVVH
jgi:hypothetical protein